MNRLLSGLVAASHSPFHEDGTLAAEIVPSQAAFLAAQGIKTVFVAGSTGESHSLTRDERAELFRAWANAAPAHGISVIAHVGGNCITDAQYLATVAADLKLTAIAALSPSYFKPADLDALIACCAKIAAAAPSLPFYYYDIPVLTGVEFPMDEFLRRAPDSIPTLAGIKYTNADLSGYRRALAVAGDRFELPWGIDEHLVDALEAGAQGAVGSSYNLAAPLAIQLIREFEVGQIDEARISQQRLVDLIELVAGCGYLAASKAVLSRMGLQVGS